LAVVDVNAMPRQFPQIVKFPFFASFIISPLLQSFGVSKKVDAVKNKDGNVLTKEEDIRTRWKEHFSEVLNRLDPIETAEIQTEDNNELIFPFRTRLSSTLYQLSGLIHSWFLFFLCPSMFATV
jgi:hypothetical protein